MVLSDEETEACCSSCRIRVPGLDRDKRNSAALRPGRKVDLFKVSEGPMTFGENTLTH